MPLNHLIENVASIIEAAPLKLPRKWANVRSISIKTSDSMALPIYNKVPEEIAEIAKLAGVEEQGDSELLALEEAKAKKDIAAKKKRKAKSPLVQALKQMEGEAEIKRDDDRQSKKAKKLSIQEIKMSEPDQSEAIKDKAQRIEDNQATKSTASKKKRKEHNENAVKEIPKATETKKQRMEKAVTGTPESKNKYIVVAEESTKDATKVTLTKKIGKGASVEVMLQESKDASGSKNKKGKDNEKIVAVTTVKSVEAVKPVENKTPDEVDEKTQVKKTKETIKLDNKTVKTEVVVKPAESKKRKKDTEEKKMTKKKDDKNAAHEANVTNVFIASSKFTGSKLGYVFRKGSQGVGYYVDVKPVVDKMAMQALAKLGKSSPRGGAGSGKKGKRGRR